MKNIIRGSFLISLIAVAGYGFGCNPTQTIQDKVSEKVAEGLLGKASGGKVDLNKDGSNVSFTDNKTGDQVAFGENVRIPDDFPKDVPIYPGAKATNISISRADDRGALAILTTEDEVSKVMTWYKDQLQSWKETQNMTINGAEYREYQKDNKKIALTISSETSDEKSTTGIMITFAEEKAEAGTSQAGE